MTARHINRIGERDFWSAWKTSHPQLGQAVRLGLAGRKAAAYRALAEFHRHELAGELEHARREAANRNAAPPQRRQTWAKADDVRAGRINGWHSQVIDFGRHIDFNADFGESGQYGFHYLSWLSPLVDRFLLGGDGADLERVVDIVRQYYGQRNTIRRRIPHLDPVYYELGSWCKVSHLLPAYCAMVAAGHGQVDPKAVEAFAKLLLGFGRSLMDIQQTQGQPVAGLRGLRYRPGNWQIVGAEALFCLAAVFPQLREAPRWRQAGLEIMRAHLDRDFFADGGHFERCWSYGWMSLRGVLSLYETARRHGLLSAADDREFRQAIRRGFEWFRLSLTPTGVCPGNGDGDLFDGREILAAARPYLGRRADQPAGKSVLLGPSGYAVLRDGAAREGLYMNINFGPWGGGHTNDDLLDFNAWGLGGPLLEEVARFDSYDHPLNPFFRSPQAHNQVVIDDFDMDRRQAVGQDVVFKTGRGFDYFHAWHDAFKDRRTGIRARIARHVLFLHGLGWFVYDLIEPVTEMIFTVSSWLHAVRPFRLAGERQAVVTGRPSCAIAFADSPHLRRLEAGVDVAEADVTVPRLYPERHYLRARAWGPTGYRGPLRFAMMLLPLRSGPAKLELETAFSQPGQREEFLLTIAGRRWRIAFDRGKMQRLSPERG